MAFSEKQNYEVFGTNRENLQARIDNNVNIISKIENKWENLTPWEKQKAYDELGSLMRKREQKKQLNEKSIEDRIKDIKRKFIRGKI